MFCREVKSLISPYLDGHLNAEDNRRLEEHVVVCVTCQHSLNLMNQIPLALQTDRMLVPPPEFTRVVMQRIIIHERFATGTTETQIERFSIQTHSGQRLVATPVNQPRDNQSKIISLVDRRAKTPSGYVLRFSSMAAALVLTVGMGLYFTSAGNTGVTSDAAAAVYGAISGFADTLRNALTSPLELAAGVAVAALFGIILWYWFKAARPEQGQTPRDGQNSGSRNRQ